MTTPATPHAAPAPEPERFGALRRFADRIVRAVRRNSRPPGGDANDPTALLAAAALLRGRGRAAEADQLLRRAVALREDELGEVARKLVPGGTADDAAAWVAYGTSLHALADAEEHLTGYPSPRRDDALGAFARAARLDPRASAAWRGAGAALIAADRPADALPWLERATDVRPQDLGAWELKAAALDALGHSAEAAEARHRGRSIALLRRDDPRQPPSPVAAVASLARPLLTFVWREKRGLAITAVLYVLGLVVWSLNAARRDLGPRVAADLQYLLAGLAPAVVLAVTLALLVAWFRLPAWSRDRLLAWRPTVAGRIASIGGALTAVGVAMYALLGWTGALDRWPLLMALATATVVAGVVLVGLARKGDWFFGLLWYGYGVLGVVFLAAVAFAFYADALYPRLPQSLGGGKPRCAELDLDAASVSRATLAALAATSSAPTVRTDKLEIVFQQGDVVFVQRPGDSRVIELRSGSVRAVVACG